MLKTSSYWFTLKKRLSEIGVHIDKPLFHSTDSLQILEQGLTSPVNSFSRSLDFYNEKNNGSRIWRKNDILLVFDYNELKMRFKLAPYNFFSINPEFGSRSPFKLDHEFEERSQVRIPAKYIKAVVFNNFVPKNFNSEIPFIIKKGDNFYVSSLEPYASNINKGSDFSIYTDRLFKQDKAWLDKFLY